VNARKIDRATDYAAFVMSNRMGEEGAALHCMEQAQLGAWAGDVAHVNYFLRVAARIATLNELSAGFRKRLDSQRRRAA
jgi:hypothetical protein